MEINITKSREGCVRGLPASWFAVFGFVPFENARRLGDPSLFLFQTCENIWKLKSPNLEKGVSEAFLALGLPSLAEFKTMCESILRLRRLKSPNREKGVSEAFLALGLPSLVLSFGNAIIFGDLNPKITRRVLRWPS